MNLTPENYYDTLSNQHYMSYSQFKTFRDCQSRALAELNGDYVRPESQALIHGQYLDAAVEAEWIWKKTNYGMTNKDHNEGLDALFGDAGPMIGDWKHDIVYKKGDRVRHGDYTYECLQEHKSNANREPGNNVLDQFVSAHPELISSRGATKGELKAEYRQLDRIVDRFQRDPFFMSYLNGRKQTILTGEIAGVPFKGKLDILDVDNKRIVDFKSARDFKSIYDPDLGLRVNFAEFWGYDIQAAIYTELARQSGFGQLDYYIAAVTKEPEPDLAVIHVPNKVIDDRLREVEFLAPTYHQLKREHELVELGVLMPKRCEKCDWCKRTKVLTNTIELEELDEY